MEEFMNIEVRPFQRFFARFLDYIILYSLVLFLLCELLDIQPDLFNSFLCYLLSLFLWIFIEALMLSVLGTTPGKWLLNITVRDEQGNKLRFVPAIKRSTLVWLTALWAGIPFVNMVGLILSYIKLTRERTTHWDRKIGCTVGHECGQLAKQFTMLILYISFASIFLRPTIDDIMKDINLIYSSVFSDPFDYDKSYESAYYLNEQGFRLIDQGQYNKAKEVLTKGLEAYPDRDVKDALYGNLSMSCYHLGEYEQALQYIEYGLDILPSDSNEYLHCGNVLYAMDKLSDAERAYEKALNLDKFCSNAHYGLGMIHYDNADYTHAIDAFKLYTGSEKKDPDGWSYLGLSYMYGEKEMVKAKECLDKAYKLDSSSVFAINSMVEYYSYLDDSDKAEKFYESAIADNSGNYELLCSTAEYFYSLGKCEEAITYADQAITIYSANNRAYKVKAEACLWNDNGDEALETVEMMIRQNPSDADVYYLAGEIYYGSYEYKTAMGYYEKAIERNPLHEDAILGKIGCFYYRKRYTACLNYALHAEKDIDSKEIHWFIADTYSALHDSENAINFYRSALTKNPDNINLIISLGWEYYIKGGYKQAEIYADQALQIDSTDYGAKNLKDSIIKKQRSLIEQVSEFIETNYMYYSLNDDYELIRNRLKGSSTMNPEDIDSLFESVRLKDDLFSFVLYGDYYKEYQDFCSSDTVKYHAMDKNVHYMQITGFTEDTSNDFLDIIEGIENPQNSNLIIDLRGNSGGDTNSGCNILDFLLPDCVVCNLIYKDGYSYPFYSDDENISFKQIFVLTDEYSASCAELVTLGLKTYLDNVTIIGRQTYGKGVGQIGYEDASKELAVFIVNHYWNVREINIMDKGIQPDIPVQGDSLEKYLDEVYNIIGSQR